MYLLRITEVGEQIDHVVILTVDKGIILGTVDRDALSNYSGSLRAILRIGRNSYEVSEIRELESQSIGKRKTS